MKIRFIQGVAGHRFAYEPGDEPDLRVDIAQGFIKQGVAVRVDDPALETAVVAAPETAAARPRRRRSVRGLLGLDG